MIALSVVNVALRSTLLSVCDNDHVALNVTTIRQPDGDRATEARPFTKSLGSHLCGVHLSRSHISEADSYLRLIDSCITQLKAQRPSRTCNKCKEEEEEEDRISAL